MDDGWRLTGKKKRKTQESYLSSRREKGKGRGKRENPFRFTMVDCTRRKGKGIPRDSKKKRGGRLLALISTSERGEEKKEQKK